MKLTLKYVLTLSLFVMGQLIYGQTESNTQPENALRHYLNNGDTHYTYEVKKKYELGTVTAYDLLLTSQKWREHLWQHQLTILVPEKLKYTGALLFITGGSVNEDGPKWKKEDDGTTKRFAQLAEINQAVTAIVRQTPKQPLYDGLVEDQLISFTLHNFRSSKDYSWPLLFPMVKSAVRAMDAVQDFSKKTFKHSIDGFTVSGASKRGWTTWLTGANDPRVKAIGPMVIDVLNMPVSLDYQLEAWQEYSIQIEDYTKLEIPQQVSSPDGNALTTMIDPYSYRKDLTMPKLIFIGTNDEYWPVDAIKNYIEDIPGDNFVHYTPNAGHDLAGGEEALKSLSGFWANTLRKNDYPDLNYKINTTATSATLEVEGSTDALIGAYVWSATSTDRDFRDEEFSAQKLSVGKSKSISHTFNFPKKGYKALYIDLEYQSPSGGTYTKSTRMYLMDDDEVL
ncbi:PhoPQ-activated pathogenicity-related family protein [Sediminicola luteus]|uniref:PhoPQ-activated pathogenicity-like protein PqaA type n=1 Tax=Sediminicola luteus TaxID=319238 RepID=A0A2A4GAF9_9FLAO|nr:PhoPQ-activated protein PqaA family protein [Sediminicola luteus]PCE64732.1 PhoPQ-activated pathogenicity-like protein PqaA type [Sediminicola luteus]